MEVTCPMNDSRELSDNDDQEMAEKQTQPGLTQEEQEAHDLETKGYCITNWKQLCSTAEAAKAKRKAYKAERQQRAKQRNAFHKHDDSNKDRIILAKSFEIEDLCARLNGVNQERRDLCARLDDIDRKHQVEIERITGFRDRELRNLRQQVRNKNELIEKYSCVEKEKMKTEHVAELRSRDQMQAMLLVDLRDLCQVYDEEVEVMKETMDRQALPPDYSSLNIQGPLIALTDTGPASTQLVITTAISDLRKALASPTTPNPLTKIANTLHTCITTINKGHSKHLWPIINTAASLHGIHQCVDRVIHFLSLHPALHNASQYYDHNFPPLTMTTSNPNTLLRRAFSAADTLALEVCSLHFASGGRKAGLMLPFIPQPLNHRTPAADGLKIIDAKDDLLELQYWKRAFEGVRRDAVEWKEEVGVTVFGDTVAWLEQEIMSLL